MADLSRHPNPQQKNNRLHCLWLGTSAFVRKHYPGLQLLEVTLRMSNDKSFSVSVPSGYNNTNTIYVDDLHQLFLCAAGFVHRQYVGLILQTVELRISGGHHFSSSLPPDYSISPILTETLDIPGDVDHRPIFARLVEQAKPRYSLDDDGMEQDKYETESTGEVGITEPKIARDYCSVVWYDGVRYSFTPTQGAAFKVLHESSVDGTCELRQETILEAIDSTAKSLNSIFRRDNLDHPAWGKVIVSGSTRGTFRLAPAPSAE